MKTMLSEKFGAIYATTVRIFAILSVVSFFCSCAGRGENADDVNDGRLQYEIQVNNVDVVPLERRNFTRQLIANGRLSAVVKSSMSFMSPGVISDIYVANGQRIKAGTLIARQDSSAKSLALESARITLVKAELDYYDVLAGQGYTAADTVSVPDNVMQMAKMRSGYSAALIAMRQAELEYSGTVIRAPFDGMVADMKLHEYDNSGSDPFCTLLDDSEFDVDFMVLESEYGFIGKGLEVKIIPFFGEPRTLYGKITGINPAVDKNGQVQVKARVRNDGTLIDGMNVRVAVERSVPDMLVVPKSAVVIRDNLEVLFRYSQGKAHWTYVNVLMSNSTEHAVTANTERGAELAPGDSIIVSGNLNLADGSEVSLKE